MVSEWLCLVKCGPLAIANAPSTSKRKLSTSSHLYQPAQLTNHRSQRTTMEHHPLHHLILFLLLSIMYHTSKVSSSGNNACNRSTAECFNEYYENLMATEVGRRFLEQKKYISPGALKRDEPVCHEGASGDAYSNSRCLPPSSNPYNRGCSKYYRCRSDS